MRLGGWLMLLVSLAFATACTGTGGGVTQIDGGCTTCVPDGGKFAIHIVDGTFFAPGDAGQATQSQVIGFETIPLFQMQLAPNGNIGIAYVEFSADQVDFKPRPDPNVFNYDILYTEWSPSTGQVALAPERVTGSVPVQVFVGVSLDYQANGQPAVGLLGWAAAPGYDGSGGIDGGTSNQAFWFQRTAVVSYRNLNGGGTPGTWTQETAESNPGELDQAANDSCAGNGSCVQGPITGLYPALFIDSTETITAYRNVHYGSSSGTGDFANSNLDIAFGGPTSWQWFGLAWGKPGISLSNPGDPASNRN